MPQPPPDWLIKYFQRGFRLVFYPSAYKGPVGIKDWPSKVYHIEDYTPGDNVGVMTGVECQPGKYLVDIDFDWPEGAKLARKLLPLTGFGFGRASHKITHAFYTISKPMASVDYKKPDGSEGKPSYVELRCLKQDLSVGLQTMVPPSTHPETEEAITFGIDGDIAHDDSLPRRILLYAIGCVLLQHVGQRGLYHDARLCTAGFLLQQGLEPKEVVDILESVAEITGNDVSDVKTCVKTTAERLSSGAKVAAGSAFLALLGEEGKKVIARIRDWTGGREFRRDKKQIIIPNDQENISLALDKLGARMAYNDFQQKEIIVYNEYDGLFGNKEIIGLWLDIEKKFKFRPSKDYFVDVVYHIAHHQPFHPVREYLDALVWDQIPRIDTWLSKYAGATQSKFVEAVSPLVLMAAVRRIRNPGCKFDEMLVLEGAQGVGKSSLIRNLCPDEKWFADDLALADDSKSIIEQTAGKWIIEVPEMYGSKRDAEHIKSFLSRQTDGPVRMAYERVATEVSRQFILVGSTNTMTHYLLDDTGGRRFWPVSVAFANVEAITKDRDQLWAEASHREAAGLSIRLPQNLWSLAALEQEKRRSIDEWEDIIADAISEWSLVYCDGKDPDRMPVKRIWKALGVSNERKDNRASGRVASIMQRLGYTRRVNSRVPVFNDEDVEQMDPITGQPLREVIRCWGKVEVEDE